MLLGIKGFILAINKMDLIRFSEKKNIIQFLKITVFSVKKLGLKIHPNTNFSSKWRQSLISKSTKMPWYKGELYYII